MGPVFLRSFRILLAIVLAVVPFVVQADIVESGEALVKRRQHNLLKLLNEKFGSPIAPFPGDQALVCVEMSGTSLSVLIVGPIAGNAKAYATALDEWRAKKNLPGTVLYSQEDDCAAATWELTRPKLWAKSAKLEVSLRSLATALSQVDKKVQFTLNVRKASAMQDFPPPGATSSGGSQLWKFDKPSEVPEVGIATTTAGPNDGTLAIVWLLFMPVVTWIIAPIVWFATMRFGSDVVEKRRFYSKAVMGGIIGAIGLHAVASMFVLTGGTFNPIAQIWFASRFTSVAIPVVLVGLPIGLIPLFILQKKEKELFGLREGEPAVERKFVVSEAEKAETERATKIIKWVAFGTIAAFAIFYVVTLMLPKGSPLKEVRATTLILGGFVVMQVVSGILNRRRGKITQANPAYDELARKLQARAAIANQAMRTNAKVTLDTSMGTSFSAMASTGNEVKIGVDTAATLDDQELDFIIAHELAHIKLKHPQKRRLFLLAPAFFIVPMSFVLVLWPPAFRYFLLFPLLMLVPIVAMRKSLQRQELECDQMAVMALGSKEAAKSALLKITYGSEMPGMHTIDTPTHPAVQKRMQAIDALPWPLS